MASLAVSLIAHPPVYFIKLPEEIFEIQSEQIQKLGKFESQLYRQANQRGIAAGFVAAPRREGKPNDPVQIRRLHRNDPE